MPKKQSWRKEADVVIVVPLACVTVELSMLYVIARLGTLAGRLRSALANVAAAQRPVRL